MVETETSRFFQTAELARIAARWPLLRLEFAIVNSDGNSWWIQSEQTDPEDHHPLSPAESPYVGALAAFRKPDRLRRFKTLNAAASALRAEVFKYLTPTDGHPPVRIWF